jgi:hypothetical protein
VWVTPRFQRKIGRALALQRRGEVRTDGLKLLQACTKLEITWSARDIHPWDREDPPDRKAARLVDQSLEDAEAAIRRLFEALPEIDVITVSVVESGSDKIIMAGTVHRSSMDKTAISVKMRLANWGLRFTLSGSHFEPLSANHS